MTDLQLFRSCFSLARLEDPDCGIYLAAKTVVYMKPIVFVILLTLSFGPLCLSQETHDADSKRLLEVIRAIQAEQVQVAEQQRHLDEKIDHLAETIRLARIEAERSGGKHVVLPVGKKK
jgi:hypothetical protein